jgi:kynurenine formamidase
MSAPKPQPERTKIRQDAVRKLAKRAVKAAGIDIPSIKLVDEIVKLVTVQCEEARARHAEMLRIVSTRPVCEDETAAVLFDRMANIIEAHWVDEMGEVCVPEEMP